MITGFNNLGWTFNYKNCSIYSWLLSIYIAIWFLQIGNRIDFLGSLRFEFLLGAFLAVAAIFKSDSDGSVGPLGRVVLRLTIAFYCVLILYTLCSYNRDFSITVFYERVFKFSLISLFLARLIKNQDEFLLVFLGFIFAMSKIALEAFIGGYTGGLVWQNQGIDRLHGATELFRHPNSLAGLLVGAVPFFLLILKFSRGLLKCAFFILLLFAIYGVIKTGSRTGYVAVLAITSIVIARNGILNVRVFLGFTIVCIALIFFVPEEYVGRFMTMFKEREEMGGSANARIQILIDAIDIYVMYPLGVGVAAFPYIRELEFGRMQDTHNLYLEVLTNLGPIGLLLFLFLIFYCFKALRVSQSFYSVNGRPFIAEFCFSLQLYLVARLALGMFGMDLYEIYWWLIIGWTVCLHKGLGNLKEVKCSSPAELTENKL